jgi:hypothetical protein
MAWLTGKSLTAFLIFLITLSAGNLQAAQGDPATIPDGLLGTYTVTLTDQGGTQFTSGQSKTFVVAPGGMLCIDGKTYSGPTVFNLPGRAAWLNSSDNQYFVVEDITTGSFTNFTIVSNPSGAYYGLFGGQKTGSDTSGCGTAAGTGTVTLDSAATSVLDLALEVYPSLFGQGSELKQAQGYVYRFFASSGIYVGFKDGKVYVVGGPFGDKILEKGTIATVTTALNTAKANIALGGNVDAGGNGSGSANGDLWDITISGTTSITLPVVGTQTVAISALTLENVTSTNPASEQEIENIIEEYFKDYGTITELKVVIVNNTANRVTLDLTFKGTVVSSGVSVATTYNLRYDFNKK